MDFQEHQSNVDPNSASRTFGELIALAEAQHAQYEQNSEIAIRHYHAAFDLDEAPDTTVDYAQSYRDFRQALVRARGWNGDYIADRYLEKVLEFTPPTHRLRPVISGFQATSYTRRYQHTQDVADLHLAVGILKTIMDTIAATHPQRVDLLMEFGSVLLSRYIALQDEDDLNLSIRQSRIVLADCPDRLLVPTRQVLATALDARYKLYHDISDIDLAVEVCAAGIGTLQQQPMEYHAACMRYAVALYTRFHRKDDLDDLQVVIRYFEVVITGCPPGHQYHSAVVVFYAELLVFRSVQRQSIQDIDKAIICIRDAMPRHEIDSSRSELLRILGYCLVSRFVYCGSAADLESGVESCHAAIFSHSSLDAASRANNFNRLAFALFTRYQLQGDMMDSTRARAYFYEALEHCYASVRSIILTNLALSLLFRYSLLGDLSDVDVAFSLCKTSLDLQTENHPTRGRTLICQARALVAMLTQKHTIVDTEIALDILHTARNAFTSGHPLFIETYRDLSHVYFLRHSITNSNSDLEHAFEYRRSATQYSNGGSQTRFEAAMQWVESAEKFSHPSLLDAYKSAIRILDLHLVLKPSLNLRHDIIQTQALSICADAASFALGCQDVVGAVEMFEQSRCLFWTFMARLRTPLDELRMNGPGGQSLADEFENLSRQLEAPMALGDDGEYGQRFRRIQRNWNAVVDKIRTVNGFGKFLLPPSYKDLQVAAVEGPVIILNASRYSCDAVIVLARAEPIHIAFPEVAYSDIVALSSEFHAVRCRVEEKRMAPLLRRLWNFFVWQVVRRSVEERRLSALLRRLWDSIVSKVVRVLEPHAPKNSRIWWCPTCAFTSLPVHAAHPFRKGECGLSDVYVSSYTPTLSALIRSRSKRLGNAPPSVASFVSIGQPNAPGYAMLGSVREELDMVRQLLPASVPFDELIDDAATCEAALTALSTHTCAHLACHGEQVPGQPYESYFAMRDGDVTLLDIIHRQVGHATESEFAFLSACKTATGDELAPDEVVHLAAALQFAGVRSVVGTMWSVVDQTAVHIAEAFYRAMVREDGVFDPSRAARALRAAVRVTRDRVPLDQQIVFIHIGV